jgi:hypothetical protein
VEVRIAEGLVYGALAGTALEGGQALFDDPCSFLEPAKLLTFSQQGLPAEDGQVFEIALGSWGRRFGQKFWMISQGVHEVFQVVRDTLEQKCLSV